MKLKKENIPRGFLGKSEKASHEIKLVDYEWKKAEGLTNEDFPFSKFPKMSLDLHILDGLDESKRESILKNCLQDKSYRKSAKLIDRSLSELAIKTNTSLEFAKKMNQRVLAIMKLDAEYRAMVKDETLKGEYNVKEELDEILKSTLGKCKAYELGCVGNDPLAILDVVEKGNLRERMFFLYRTTHGHLGNQILEKPAKLKWMRQKMKERHFAFEFPETIDPFNAFSYGAFARISTNKWFRKARPQANRSTFLDDSYRGKIPFSTREHDFLMKKYLEEGGKDDFVPTFKTGRTFFTPNTNKDLEGIDEPAHPYLTAAETLGLPLVAGISGTTDQILTMANYLGVNSKDDLLKARLALIGWMVDNGDHSVYEILTASRSFKHLDIDISPDYYKSLFPASKESKTFLKKLKALHEKSIN